MPLAARVALTLRTVAGLPVAEIARAFLVSETTMAQRLVRARRKIEHAGIPYRVPPAELLEERLNGVLAVLYLAFNAGYSDVAFTDVAESAVALAEAVVDLMPLESEACGLLALMLMQNSRRSARLSPSGELLTLEEQDRSLWNRADIDRGCAMLASARERGRVRPAGVDRAVSRGRDSAASTDWSRIVALYDELLTVDALADHLAQSGDRGRHARRARCGARAARRHQCAARRLPPRCRRRRPICCARAGRIPDAAARYREAIALAPTTEERAQLHRRLFELGVSSVLMIAISRVPRHDGRMQS